jgi:hypothetical protein
VRLRSLALFLAAATACGGSEKESVKTEPAEKKRSTTPAPPPIDALSIDGPPPPSAGSGSNMSNQQLAIKLVTSGTTVSMADRAKFTVGFEVENRGTAAVDPAMGGGNCTLTVNGVASTPFNLAVSNGGRPSTWRSLPPGKKLALSWPLGEALFPSPGDYHLVMTVHGADYTADVKVQ